MKCRKNILFPVLLGVFLWMGAIQIHGLFGHDDLTTEDCEICTVLSQKNHDLDFYSPGICSVHLPLDVIYHSVHPITSRDYGHSQVIDFRNRPPPAV